MRNVFFCLIALFYAATATAQSSAPPLSPPTLSHSERFNQDMQAYFRSPDPHSMIRQLMDLPVSNLKKPELPFLMGAFFCHLIDASPDVAEQLVAHAATGGPELKAIIIQSLNLSHHPQRLALIGQVVGDGQMPRLNLDGFSLKSMPITHPGHLDMMWASFFATGDGAYVERVAETLPNFRSDQELAGLSKRATEDPEARRVFRDALIAQAAAWSLTTNGRTIPEVREILASLVHRQPGHLAGAILEKIPTQ